MRRWFFLVALLGGCLSEYTVGGQAGTCPDGQVPCAQGCVAAGSCESCAEGQELCDGACVAAGACDGETCPAGQVRCGYDCVAADTCPCDRGCDAELEACVADVCVCRDGLERCGGACVDTRADAEHCGECDAPCAAVCQAGACVDACAAPLSACGGACVDLATDALHCGECGDPCKSDELCFAGECREYGELAGCDACPCADACEEDDDEDHGACCDSPFLAAPVCVPDGCG
jgi:hypothetical protein